MSRRPVLILALLAGALAGVPAAHAVVPGENGKVAFTSNRDGDYDIYAVEADGSGLVQLTGNPGADDGPAWSPDGSRIAFVSCSDPSQDPIADPWGATSCEIYVMNADGSGQTRLTSNSAIDLMPAWSPDGASIAYTSGWDIWVMNADGSGQRNLTSTPVFGVIFGMEESPDWSPDGRWIAYDGTVTGGGCVNELFLSDPVAATRVRLTQEATFCDNAASWSPDGAISSSPEPRRRSLLGSSGRCRLLPGPARRG